jgi:signal transduction histidine kinase
MAATRRVHRIDATFAMKGDVEVRDPEVAMHLYRITQEALSNSLKHGKATRIALSLEEGSGTLRLTLSDNGIGLPASPAPDQGMGLKTMKHRAHLIGAEMILEPNPAGGVRMVCVLPHRKNSPPAPPSPTA